MKEKERNYFYTVQFKNGDLSDANYQSEPFWEALLSQAEEQLTEANKTYLSEVLETAEDALQAYTGSNDFYDFLEDAYGSEYVNKYIDSISESPVRKVTEDLNFIVDYRSTINLKKPLSILSQLPPLFNRSSQMPVSRLLLKPLAALPLSHLQYCRKAQNSIVIMPVQSLPEMAGAAAGNGTMNLTLLLMMATLEMEVLESLTMKF